MEQSPNAIQLHVPFSTLLKIALFILLIICVIKLWPAFLMFVIATLLAVTLEPVVQKLEQHRVRRSIAVLLLGALMLTVLALFFGVLLPQIAQQLGDVAKDMQRVRGEVAQKLPPSLAPLREVLLNKQSLGPGVQQWLGKSMAAGMRVIEALTAFFFVLIVALYLLIEGKVMYAWLVSFIPDARRDRVAATADEMAVVVRAYIRGQVITSAICGAYVFVVLLALHVPAALFLGVAAAIFDIIPIIGTILLIAAPTLVALTVSPAKAVAVLALLVAYHFMENYFIVPRVYGKQMRMSTLTVLLAITVGGILQGIIGMVLVLPLVAAYPIIERMWLRRVVGDETVRDHQKLEHDQSGRAADEIAHS